MTIKLQMPLEDLYTHHSTLKSRITTILDVVFFIKIIIHLLEIDIKKEITLKLNIDFLAENLSFLVTNTTRTMYFTVHKRASAKKLYKYF